MFDWCLGCYLNWCYFLVIDLVVVGDVLDVISLLCSLVMFFLLKFLIFFKLLIDLKGLFLLWYLIIVLVLLGLMFFMVFSLLIVVVLILMVVKVKLILVKNIRIIDRICCIGYFFRLIIVLLDLKNMVLFY